jgi:hypothetical protein
VRCVLPNPVFKVRPDNDGGLYNLEQRPIDILDLARDQKLDVRLDGYGFCAIQV